MSSRTPVRVASKALQGVPDPPGRPGPLILELRCAWRARQFRGSRTPLGDPGLDSRTPVCVAGKAVQRVPDPPGRPGPLILELRCAWRAKQFRGSRTPPPGRPDPGLWFPNSPGTPGPGSSGGPGAPACRPKWFVRGERPLRLLDDRSPGITAGKMQQGGIVLRSRHAFTLY